MELRRLGRTGVEVSPLCLGAMMFGAWGNPDHDESVRIIHAALDAGINFVDTADVYSRGESEEIVAKALAGRRDGSCSRRRSTADGRRIRTARKLAPLDRPGGRGEPAPAWRPTGSTCTRSTAGIRTPTSTRRSARSPTSCTPGRSATSAPRPSRPTQIVEAQWVAERRGRERFVCEQPPYSILVRGIERDVLPVCAALRDGRDPVEPARRRLALRPLPEGEERRRAPRAPDPGALRHEASREPGEARGGRGSSRCSPRRPGSR